MKYTIKCLAIGCLLMGVPAVAMAGETVTNSFSSGEVVSASKMNSNFSFLADRSWGLIGTDLYYTDGRVGIGTSSPATKLDIVGNGSTNYSALFHVKENGTSAIADFEHSSGATATVVGGDINSFFGSRSNHPAAYGANNTAHIWINTNGNVGIGKTTTSYPLEMASGAHVTIGGVWTDASSRGFKENIKKLKAEEAYKALRGLEPVTYNYKVDQSEEYVGFIAEDVPEMVAMKDRKSLSPMDMVGVLTKVVQEQDSQIVAQNTQISALTALVCVDHPEADICQK
ncbi:MAG: tail fiber domain-containing protein [Proteobacteria bacterium]|nr:tail fiber domain-containing protein [Pseudomonadota bacterium]MBU1687117.1 tail fiber domain-containing protein [Pseudomonadota bacterium]